MRLASSSSIIPRSAPPLAGALALLAALTIGCAPDEPQWKAPPPGGSDGTTPADTSGTGLPSGTCSYPGGSYGNEIGDRVDPELTWAGYTEGSADPGKVAIRDYFDCDGSKGINAILALEVSILCEPCREEAKQLHELLADTWKKQGIRVISLIVLDQNGDPATPQSALAWRDEYQLDQAAVVADPSLTFPPGPSGVTFPGRAVIDPRTMKIIDVSYGDTGDPAVVEQLADKNAK